MKYCLSETVMGNPAHREAVFSPSVAWLVSGSSNRFLAVSGCAAGLIIDKDHGVVQYDSISSFEVPLGLIVFHKEAPIEDGSCVAIPKKQGSIGCCSGWRQ